MFFQVFWAGQVPAGPSAAAEEDTAHAPSSALVPLEEDTARAPSSALQLVCFEDPRSAAAEVAQLRRKSTRNSPSTNFYRPPGAFAQRACSCRLRRVVLLRVVCAWVGFAARMYVKIPLSPVSFAEEAFLAGADLGGGPGGRNARHGRRRRRRDDAALRLGA